MPGAHEVSQYGTKCTKITDAGKVKKFSRVIFINENVIKAIIPKNSSICIFGHSEKNNESFKNLNLK